MTEALASRVAGLKLGGIVAVLLLPMIVLSFFMVGSLRDDMQFARRELLGVEMSRLVMPVAMGAASGNLMMPTSQPCASQGTAGCRTRREKAIQHRARNARHL